MCTSAAVTSCSGTARLFTTVVNPILRGPVATAKVLATLDDADTMLTERLAPT